MYYTICTLLIGHSHTQLSVLFIFALVIPTCHADMRIVGGTGSRKHTSGTYSRKLRNPVAEEDHLTSILIIDYTHDTLITSSSLG